MDQPLLSVPGYLAAIALRAACLIVVGCLLAVLFRRSAAVTRRRLWAAVLIGLVLLPAAALSLPSLRVELPARVTAPTAELTPVDQRTPAPLGHEGLGAVTDARDQPPPMSGPLAPRESRLPDLGAVVVVLW